MRPLASVAGTRCTRCDARFVLEAGEHALARDRCHDLLEAAEIDLRHADDLGLPAALLGVAAVHAEQIGCEQRRLVAAGAGAHLQDGALVVGRVLGEEMQAQFLQQLAPAVIDLIELLLSQLPEILVGRGVVGERSQLAPLGFGLAILEDGLDHGIELGEFLGELDAARLVDALVQLGLDRWSSAERACRASRRGWQSWARIGHEGVNGSAASAPAGGHRPRRCDANACSSATCRPCATADRRPRSTSARRGAVP